MSDWRGTIDLSLKGLTAHQAKHKIRVAVKSISEMAARLGIPVALEALDFQKKKADLRYQQAGRAAQLSSFAYSSILESIQLASVKRGVEVLWVAPAFTSISGWVKFGARLGLSVDTAAAFAIARKAATSGLCQSSRAQAPGGWARRPTAWSGCLGT